MELIYNNILILFAILLPSIFIFVFLLKHFEFTIFIALLADIVSAFFVPNISHLETVSEVTIGSYLRILLIVFISCISIVYILKNLEVKKIFLSNPFFLILPFLILAFSSVIYSIDPNFTLIRSTTFLLVIIYCMGIYLWLQDIKRYEKILNAVYYFAVFFIIINLLVIIFIPSKAWWITAPNRLQGVLSQPNSLGAESRDFFFVLLWRSNISKSKTEKIFVYSLTTILFAFVLLSGSRTSLITLIAGLLLWLVLNKKGIKIISFVLVSLFLLIIFPYIEPSNMVRDDNSRTTLFTGREEFWSDALILISESPYLGYGFEVSGKVWEDPRFYNPDETLWSGSAKQSLHNGYISTIIGVGIPGFILFLFIIIVPLIKLKWKSLTPEVDVVLIIFLIYIISNFVESMIGSGSILFWFSWTLIVAYNRKIISNESLPFVHNASYEKLHS